jgi:radical SAM protein with 4Fe4S-binding SPASM domain
MNNIPVLCTAPFTSIVITPERTLRPCCKYVGNLGDLNKQTITEILSNNIVKNLQKDMYDNRWPVNCYECKSTEKITGKSVRKAFIPGGVSYSNNWKDSITVIELSSSNICNLSCAGCSTRFSSGWVKYTKVIEKTSDTKFYRDIIQEGPIINPDNDLLIKNLSGLDLTYLNRVNIKGGEPLMNTDMLAALRYFNEIDILHKLHLVMDTSGAVIIDKTINETIALLCKAKQVDFNISVDGPEDVQTYIRYSAKKLASLDKMRNFMSIFEKNNINFMVSPTIMVYNIFSLDKLIEWWFYEMRPAFKHLTLDIHLFNFLIGPDYLSLRALQPATISKLIDYYNNIIKTKAYGPTLSHFPDALENIEYGGHKLHNQMVKYTLDMDKIKGQSVYKAIPELTNEMILI